MLLVIVRRPYIHTLAQTIQANCSRCRNGIYARWGENQEDNMPVAALLGRAPDQHLPSLVGLTCKDVLFKFVTSVFRIYLGAAAGLAPGQRTPAPECCGGFAAGLEPNSCGDTLDVCSAPPKRGGRTRTRLRQP